MYTFRQLNPGDDALAQALDMMRVAFAGMDGRIDPPSSITTLTLEGLDETAATSEVWVTGDPVVGTVILSPKRHVLYVGKLAVRDRRKGVGAGLMHLAQERAAALGFGWLELQSRVELVEVHAVFKRLGFHEVARTTHTGFSRPTSIVFRKAVS